MKNYLSCLAFAALWILGSTSHALAQSATYGEQKTLQINAQVNSSTPSITLNWAAFQSLDSIQIFKTTSVGGFSSSPTVSLSGTATSYTDNSVSTNQYYEYKVIGFRSSGYDAYGYIATGIGLDENTNKGLVAVIIDSSLLNDLETELEIYKKDLMGDNYDVIIQAFDTSQSGSALKDSIASLYTNYSNLNTVFLIGALPYAYTGAMSPDGHFDHHGAWPSDLILADVNGTYSDVNVQWTNPNDSRLSNDTSDTKKDQSYLASNAELQIGRLDLSRLSSFSQSEITLYKNYFAKLHQYKTGEFTPRNTGIVDDNFTSYTEGFSQNGYRNFSPLTHIDSVTDVNILTRLGSSSSLWTYACGAGSYTSISGFSTTSQLASNSLNGAFSLVFGSYNGDVDVENNVMRAMLANGNFLTTGWAGRPNWFMHHMAIGEPIGKSTLITQNNTNATYAPSGYYSQMMHVMLLGDPTLKNHYTPNIENLTTIRDQTKDTAFFTWDSLSYSNLGVNIYRSTEEFGDYVKINSSPIQTTSYTDIIDADTNYYYRFETVELFVNNSGSYYESSVGSYIMSDKDAAPLPVTLIDFTAVKQDVNIALEWTVADEIDFSHYELEKYNETIQTWEKISMLIADGSSNSIKTYNYLDTKPLIGKNIYRLKMVDLDASFEYSDLRIVEFDPSHTGKSFNLYPNLASDHVNINCNMVGSSNYRTFHVKDLSGTLIKEINVTTYDTRIDISDLPNGIYFVSDLSEGGQTKKLIKTN